MDKPRRFQRNRTYLRGRIAYNNRCSTMDCMVRNLSQNGARLVFGGATAVLPHQFEIAIRRNGPSQPARIVWRDETEAGVEFLHRAPASATIEAAAVIAKLRKDCAALAMRVAQLSAPA